MKKLFVLFLTLSVHLMSSPDVTWTSPTVISNTGADASNPRLVIDDNNNVTATWQEAGVVKTSSLPSGGSWGSITTLSGSSSSNAGLGIASNGDIIALWIENGIVKSARLPFGGSWGTPQTVSSSGASQARLAVDNSGNAVAIWVRNGFIESSTRPSSGLLAGLWSLVSQLSLGGSESNPDVAISQNGTIIAVWSSSSSGIDQVYSAKGSIGGLWNASMNILAVTPAMRHNYPRVAIDSNGNAAAIWFRYVQSGSAYSFIDILTASLSSSGTAWSAIPTLLTPTPGLNTNPASLVTKIGFDGSGNAYALWTISPDGQSFTIQTASQRVNTNWVVNQELGFYNLYGFSADMTIKASGNVLIDYMSFDGADTVILFTETDSSNPQQGLFSNIQTISQGTDNGYPRIAVSINSNLVNAAAVWLQYDGVNNVVQAATGSRDVIAPPTNLSVTQNVNNFGIFNDYYNTVTWDASTDPTVVSYNIFRNSAFVVTVDSSTLEFVDHNAVQNGAVTYSIVSVNDQFLQSTPAIVNFP